MKIGSECKVCVEYGLRCPSRYLYIHADYDDSCGHPRCCWWPQIPEGAPLRMLYFAIERSRRLLQRLSKTGVPGRLPCTIIVAAAQHISIIN